jgi:hypothetical protein
MDTNDTAVAPDWEMCQEASLKMLRRLRERWPTTPEERASVTADILGSKPCDKFYDMRQFRGDVVSRINDSADGNRHRPRVDADKTRAGRLLAGSNITKDDLYVVEARMYDWVFEEYVRNLRRSLSWGSWLSYPPLIKRERLVEDAFTAGKMVGYAGAGLIGGTVALVAAGAAMNGAGVAGRWVLASRRRKVGVASACISAIILAAEGPEWVDWRS